MNNRDKADASIDAMHRAGPNPSPGESLLAPINPFKYGFDIRLSAPNMAAAKPGIGHPDNPSPILGRGSVRPRVTGRFTRAGDAVRDTAEFFSDRSNDRRSGSLGGSDRLRLNESVRAAVLFFLAVRIPQHTPA